MGDIDVALSAWSGSGLRMLELISGNYITYAKYFFIILAIFGAVGFIVTNAYIIGNSIHNNNKMIEYNDLVNSMFGSRNALFMMLVFFIFFIVSFVALSALKGITP